MQPLLNRPILYMIVLVIGLIAQYHSPGYGQTLLLGTRSTSPILLEVEDSSSDCNKLQQRCNDLMTCPTDWCLRRAYDTIGVFIEHCNRIISTAILAIYLEDRTETVHFSPDSAIPYINWLKQILYDNPDSGYYCAVAYEMADAVFDFGLTGKDQYLQGAAAILDYLLATHRCPQYEYKIQSFRNQIRSGDLDTTHPTIDSIGFSVLRGPEYIPNTVNRLPVVNTLRVEAAGNPFNNRLLLRYYTDAVTALKVEIIDILGTTVYSKGLGAQQPGNHEIELATQLWATGAYYVRISTITGERVTIKLIKE